MGTFTEDVFFIIQLARICVAFHCFASSCLDYELNWACVKSIRHPPSFRHLDSSVNLTLVEKHRTKVCEAYESGLCSLQFDGSVTSTITEVTCSSGTSTRSRSRPSSDIAMTASVTECMCPVELLS